MFASNKKFKAFLLVALLLLIDYSLKVREYNNLVKAHNSWMISYQEWIDTFNEDWLSNEINPSEGWTQDNIDGFERFLRNSDDTAVEIFLLNESVERNQVLPWHREMRHAYEDLSQHLENEYQTYKGFKLVNRSEGTPRIEWGGPDSLPEMIAQAKKSLNEAKPFLNLFLDPYPYD